jgi:hypothetical protein
MLDPQLLRVLSLVKEEGSLFVFENCDPDDEFPGILRAEHIGLVSRHLSTTGIYFEFTAAGRKAMGIPPTLGDRLVRHLQALGILPRPKVKA